MAKSKSLKLVVSAAVIGQLSLAGNLQSLSIGAGKIWDTTKVLLGYLDKFASRGWGYAYSVWFLRDMKYYADDFYDWLKHKLLYRTKFREPAETEKILKKGFEKIKGQKRAKEEVMDFALRVTNEKNEAQINKRNRKGADIILMTGTSGCGKSMMAKELANAVSNAPAFVISSGDIDSKNKDSIVSQLFGERHSEVGYDRYQRTSEKNCLIAYIERVKHGVVIIEEYDKMHCESLDEVLRAFADNGSAYICGQKVDASNITFILTSNESKDSVKCKLKNKTDNKSAPNKANTEDVNSENQNENKTKDANSKEPTSDDFLANEDNVATVPNNSDNDVNTHIKDAEVEDLSRTSVSHDKSFMNRLTTVEFDRLSLKDFEEIIKSEYGESMPKYWKSYANITLDISAIFNPIAKKSISMDEHGRAPRKIMSKLTGLLSRESRKLNGKNVKVKYNEKENKFYLKIK